MAHTARLDRATAATLIAAVLMPAAVALIFFYVPSDVDQGYSQRIFYFHVPMAWVAYLAFAVVLVASIVYLWKRDLRWDAVARASVEIGVLFTTLVLVTHDAALAALAGHQLALADGRPVPERTTVALRAAAALP